MSSLLFTEVEAHLDYPLNSLYLSRLGELKCYCTLWKVTPSKFVTIGRGVEGWFKTLHFSKVQN